MFVIGVCLVLCVSFFFDDLVWFLFALLFFLVFLVCQAKPGQAKPSRAKPSQAQPRRYFSQNRRSQGGSRLQRALRGCISGGGRYLKSRFVCPGAATASPCPSHARTTRTPLTGYFPFGDPSPQTPIHIYLFQNYRKVPFRPAAPKVISASAAGPQNS